MPSLSQLDAVNMMLAAIGQAPVNSLDGQISVDVTQAVNTLTRVTTAVLSLGWRFNTDEHYEVHPDTNGNINVSESVLDVRMSGHHDRDDWRCQFHHHDVDVVLRGTQLFNIKKSTAIFKDSLKITAILDLEWDLIPALARNYIALMSSRIFADETEGSSDKHQFNIADENMALAELRRSEIKAAHARFIARGRFV